MFAMQGSRNQRTSTNGVLSAIYNVLLNCRIDSGRARAPSLSVLKGSGSHASFITAHGCARLMPSIFLAPVLLYFGKWTPSTPNCFVRLLLRSILWAPRTVPWRHSLFYRKTQNDILRGVSVPLHRWLGLLLRLLARAFLWRAQRCPQPLCRWHQGHRFHREDPNPSPAPHVLPVVVAERFILQKK